MTDGARPTRRDDAAAHARGRGPRRAEDAPHRGDGRARSSRCADAELPGVDAEAMSLREAVRIGGARTLTIIGLLGALEVMRQRACSTSSPPTSRTTLGVSDAVLGAIGGATGVLFVLGAIPMSSLSDRMPRKQLVAVTMSLGR